MLKLTNEQAQGLLNELAELPFKSINGIIATLQKLYAEQNKPVVDEIKKDVVDE